MKPIRKQNKDGLDYICHWLVDNGLLFLTVENNFVKEIIYVCDVNINVLAGRQSA